MLLCWVKSNRRLIPGGRKYPYFSTLGNFPMKADLPQTVADLFWCALRYLVTLLVHVHKNVNSFSLLMVKSLKNRRKKTMKCLIFNAGVLEWVKLTQIGFPFFCSWAVCLICLLPYNSRANQDDADIKLMMLAPNSMKLFLLTPSEFFPLKITPCKLSYPFHCVTWSCTNYFKDTFPFFLWPWMGLAVLCSGGSV